MSSTCFDVKFMPVNGANYFSIFNRTALHFLTLVRIIVEKSIDFLFVFDNEHLSKMKLFCDLITVREVLHKSFARICSTVFSGFVGEHSKKEVTKKVSDDNLGLLLCLKHLYKTIHSFSQNCIDAQKNVQTWLTKLHILMCKALLSLRK